MDTYITIGIVGVIIGVCIATVIYTSKKYTKELFNLPILLVGDAACGFPFMNGLNLGLQNSTHLIELIKQFYLNRVIR